MHEHVFPLDPVRAPHDDLRRDAAALEAVPLLRDLLEAFPTMTVILNSRRQILMYNALFGQAVPSGSDDLFFAMRLGEAVGCEVAAESPAGCGSGKACRMCGALLAMLDAANGASGARECSIAVNREDTHAALEFRAVAAPLDIGGQRVTLLSLVDISDEKRRLALERIFFHDILNTAGGVRNVAELLRMVREPDRGELIEDLNGLSEQLIEEIKGQRELLAAERDELSAAMEDIRSADMLHHVLALYRYHNVARERTLALAEETEELAFRSDPTILARVLGNLVKNALEATPPGGAVTLHCGSVPGGRIRFCVWNPASIPDSAKSQIFKRSFSTKGMGRGLGTYSARLLTEKYLGGAIGFESAAGTGTTFHVTLPGNGTTTEEEMTR